MDESTFLIKRDLTLCMLGNFSRFFKIIFIKQFFQEHYQSAGVDPGFLEMGFPLYKGVCVCGGGGSLC